MKMKARLLQLVLTVLLAANCAIAGGQIDGIVAVVNGHPLLLSDWNDALRFEALQRGPAARVDDPAGRRAAFDRIVEQELIRQQMQGLYTPEAEAIQSREQAIRLLYPEAKTEDGWARVLTSFGFNRTELENAISAELQTLRFVDIRLRPTVKVEPTEIESYYRERLVPEVKQAGGEPDPLPEVSSRIHDLLVEQKISQVFFDWIASLRSQSKIEVFVQDQVQSDRVGN
jgi:peptidyl-prolyl cis-trans isomerase SurA